MQNKPPRLVLRRQFVWAPPDPGDLETALNELVGLMGSQDLRAPEVDPTPAIFMRSLSAPLSCALTIGGGAQAPSLSNQKVQAGSTRMRNGNMEVLEPGPSGALRWHKRDEGGVVKDRQKQNADNPGEAGGKEDFAEVVEVEDAEKKKLDSELAGVTRKETEVSARLRSGDAKPIKGVEFGGLVAHPSSGSDGLWVVTHKKSGAALAQDFRNEQEAIMSAWRLSQEMDWEKSAKDVLSNPAYKHAASFLQHLRQSAYAKKPSASPVKKSLVEESARVPLNLPPSSDTPAGRVRSRVIEALSTEGVPRDETALRSFVEEVTRRAAEEENAPGLFEGYSLAGALVLEVKQEMGWIQ